MTSLNFSTADSPINSTSCPEGIFLDWIYTFLPAYIMVVCVFGLVGNTFVLLVLCLHRSHRTVPDIYLGSLAGADLLLLACLPFWAVNIAQRFSWPFGELLCRCVNLAIYMNLCSSIYFLVMVSIDRYLALVKVLNPGRIRTVSCAKINCCLIWLFSLAMSSPAFIFRQVTFVPEVNISACLLQYPHPSWQLKMDITFIVIIFLIPDIILFFCTTKILRVLRNDRLQLFKRVRKESRAVRLILVVLLAFLVCWVPFQLFRVLHLFYQVGLLTGCPWQRVLSNGNQLVTFLGCTNSCVNPVLYVMVGKQFRTKARELYDQSVARRKSALTLRDSPVTHNTSISSLERVGH
ncbi:B2 bradykinin receptor-like [Pristis pectinata]|uniref:B2 bradykinin receptor-like n=1 Tax=Pristis pectinata TaxID=685728 RepID=UPI00223CFBBB|nr:B2 bradykinin receptor-like [Pristis pectinata]XP_051887848.1 B2 bradykinin receptor-like [Pristis pectinata]